MPSEHANEKDSNLSTPSTEEPNRKRFSVLALPNYSLWNIFILISVVVDFFLCTLCFTFFETNVYAFIPFFITLDTLYIFHYALLLLHRLWKRLSTKLSETVKTSPTLLVVDLASLLPQVLLLLVLIRPRYEILVLYSRWAVCMRLHVLGYFKKVQKRCLQYRCVWFLGQSIVLCLVTLHAASTVWLLVAKKYVFCKLSRNKYDISPGTEESNAITWYFHATYLGVENLLNIGFGVLKPTNHCEIFWFIFVMLTGNFLYIVFVAIACWLMISRKFHRMMFFQMVSYVEKYTKYVSTPTKTYIRNYFQDLWENHQGIQNASLLKSLPLSLRMDIAYDINCGVLHRSLLLKNLPVYAHRKIALAMTNVYLQTESGALEAFYDDDEHNPATFFEAGTVLGEIALFLNVSSNTTIRAAKSTEIKALQKTQFMKIMLCYPDELKTMRSLILSRIDTAMKDKPEQVASPNRKKTKVQDHQRMTEGYWSLYKMSKTLNPTKKVLKLPGYDSSLKKTWTFLLSVTQVCFCIVYPYYAVFERYVPPDLFIFGVAADITYLIDLVMQCTTTVRVKDKTVTKILEIIDVNLDSWIFYCDVASLFKIEVWAYAIKNPAERNRMYTLLMLNRLLRIWRVKYLLELLADKSSCVIWVLKNIVYSLIFTYFAACLLYLISCLDLICNKDGWYHKKIVKDLQTRQEMEYSGSTLSTSIYFAAMFMCSTGVGDILPVSDRDIVTAITILFLSVVLKSYWTSQLVSSMFLKEFCTKTYELFFFMKTSLGHFQLRKPIKERLKRYVSTINYFSNKHGFRYVRDLPETLHTDLQKSILYKILTESPLFKMADPYFLAMLESEAKRFVLPENETLYNTGDCARQMFIIQQGHCNVYNADVVLEKFVGPGSQLGVIEMISDICKQHTVVAASDCFIVELDYGAFSKILKLFPKEFDSLGEVTKSQWFLKMVQKLEMDRVTRTRDLGSIYRKPLTKNLMMTGWKQLWGTYKEKLGLFSFLGVFLMPFTINPQSILLKVWCVVRCLLITLSGIFLPLLIMLPPYADYFYWLYYICQCSLYLDMYILLHVAYYTEKLELAMHPLYTAGHYFTHSFLVDSIAALPITHILLHIDPSHSNYHNLVTHMVAPHDRHCKWQLLSLIQFHRIFSYIAYLKENSFKSSNYLPIVKFLTILILIINVLACLMLTVACNYEFDKDFELSKDMTTFYDSTNNTIYFGVIKCQNLFWLKGSLYDRIKGPWELYLVCVYGVINFLTHTGTGDVTAQLWLPMLGADFAVLIGFILFIYLCGLVATMKLQKVSLGIDFRKKVEELDLFLQRNSLRAGVYKKVFDHLKFIWDRTKGLDHPKIIYKLGLNSSLTEDVLLTRYRDCLKHCELFHDLDFGGLRLIIKFIRVQHFKKGQLIVHHKDVVFDIFIVSSGEVQILNDDQYGVDILSVGAVFGNIQHKAHSCSPIYVKARRNVELCIIATEKLLNIVKHHPRISHKINELLNLKSEYIEPRNVFGSDSQKDGSATFWNEIDSDDEMPEKKSSVMLINPLVVLKPHHHIFKYTDFLTFLASCLNIIFIPYIFVTQDKSFICHLYLVLEPIFYVRICMKLRRAYYNFYGNFVKSSRKIVQKYFSVPIQVIWDVLSNIPLYLICFAFAEDDWYFFYTCLRMSHLLRIYYVLEYFKIHEEKLKMKLWLPIARLTTIYITLVHLFSCFWLMVACPFGNCYTGTWVYENQDILGKPLSIQILVSYYYIISTITTTGIGDVLPQNLSEMVFTSMIMLTGKLMIVVFIGTILWTICYNNFGLIRFEYKSMVLKKYLQNQDLSGYQMIRISSYVKDFWKYDRGQNFPKLLRELPEILTCDVMVALYGHHLRQNVLFKDIEESLLRQICSKLQRQLFFHYDYIVRGGDLNNCMYFLRRGTVTVLTKHADCSETQHVVLHPNDAFGISQGLNQSSPHHFTYRASSRCVEILALSFQSWSYLLPYFPQDREAMFAKVYRDHVKA